MRLFVLVPVYREDPRVLTGLSRRIRRNSPGSTLVMVDDGNTDQELRDTLVHISDHLIVHPENMGYTRSIINGFTLCLARGADVVLKLDADGQYTPERIPEMLAAFEADPSLQVVSGSRYMEDSPRLTTYEEREAINREIRERIAAEFPQAQVTDPFSGFRAFRRNAIEMLLPGLGEWIGREGYGLSLETTLKVIALGLRYREVGVSLYYPTLKKFPGRMVDPDYRRTYYATFFPRAHALREAARKVA